VSPKNKGKFGRAKATEIPETDEFISGIDRIIQWLKPHAARIGVLAGVVVLIVLGWTGWSMYKHRKETRATSLYVRAVALSHIPVREQADEGEKLLPPDPRGYPHHYATRKERSEAVIEALDELESDYGSARVAGPALLLEASALLDLGRAADAADTYAKFLDKGGSEELMLAAREGQAYAIEEKALAEKDPKAKQAGLEQALAAFQSLQPKADGPRHDEALYHQARLLAELGKGGDAVKRYEQLLTDHPNSELKPLVEERLLELKDQPKK
jgi:tetratricopeptide (TPR) repeat protein